MPASAIRKLVPFADAAKEQGVKVYHHIKTVQIHRQNLLNIK